MALRWGSTCRPCGSTSPTPAVGRCGLPEAPPSPPLPAPTTCSTAPTSTCGSTGMGRHGGHTAHGFRLARTRQTITANQNNYSPPVGSVVQLVCDASPHSITGMVVRSLGEVRYINNSAASSGGTLTLTNNDAASSVGNRFLCSAGANLALTIYRTASLRGTTARSGRHLGEPMSRLRLTAVAEQGSSPVMIG